MSKYKVITLTKKTIAKLGKDVIEATLSDGVAETEKVQIWQGFPNFETITFNSEVEGDIVDKMNGNFRNITLYPPKPAYTPKTSGFGGGVKAAQERKEVMIEKAQERKSDSIAYFNSVNAAIELVSKLRSGLGNETDQEIENSIIQWREWFLSEYRKYEAKDITEKRNAC